MKYAILKESIFWVGHVDWNVRDFHGYTTNRGSTYNAYLIRDKKIAIIDAVKASFSNHLLNNILSHAKFEEVDYVVCNHAEPDHTGALPTLMEKCQNAQLVCNEKCKNTLALHYDTKKWKFKVVDESTTLSLGENSLNFINTPMVHWPESMATYIRQEKILFSMDAFGQHFASSGRFDYQESLTEVMYEAKKYYANIVMLYGKPIEKVLDRVAGLEIEIIAPSHGIIWKKNIKDVVSLYKEWIYCTPKRKVVIFYDTMWKSTEMMAEAIYEGSLTYGVEVKKYDLKYTNITDIATEVLDAAAIAVGTPTLNKTLMPKVAEALTYLKGLAPINKYAVAFGSYGWAKNAGQHDVIQYLRQMNSKLLLESPVQAQFVPTEEVIIKCKHVGKMLADSAIFCKT